MPENMRRVNAPKTGCVHIETALAVINIYTGLHDREGHRVERISIRTIDYPGEPPVQNECGYASFRLIEGAALDTRKGSVTS